ncbi:hypothetical protein JCM16303_003319 [Sporobolomyces ruberrimus]
MASPSTRAGLSKRSAGVRRLLQEATELENDDSPDYNAAPLESDLFDWHFTIRGLTASQFEGGVYHGRMILPSEYPFKPPEIYLLTPSGRFEVNRKICLSISSFHPETWQPSWGVRTALLALISFFESDPKGAVGSLNAPPEERKRLANSSQHFKCTTCGYDAENHDSFSALPEATATPPTPNTDMTDAEPDTNEDESEIVPETEQTSAANSRSSSPAPVEEEEARGVESPSLPPTTIFPASPSGPRSYAHRPPPTDARATNVSLGSPTHLPDTGPPPAAAGPSRPQYHQETVAHRRRSIPSPVTPPISARTAPITHSPGTSEIALSTRPSATSPPTHQMQALSLSPQDHYDGEGGPPSYLDRAILATLLAIVALIVRKVA